jgi:hypothetical protein
VADIAVLGSPDNQSLYEQAEQYEKFTESFRPLKLAHAAVEGDAWVMKLNGTWVACRASHKGGCLWLSSVPRDIQGGMSGSPILNGAGAAIGVVTMNQEAPSPRPMHHLPAGILETIVKARPMGRAVSAAAIRKAGVREVCRASIILTRRRQSCWPARRRDLLLG